MFKITVNFMFGLTVGVLLTIGALAVHFKEYHHSVYKQAQIDYMNGKCKIKLITHPDNSKTWEYKRK